MDMLDVGTGSGYGAALLATRLGDARVTTIDIDPYLIKAAEERLARTGLCPLVTVAHATGPLPASYDRIVSMTSVAPIPASWLAALRPAGRLVTTLTGTGLIVTATTPATSQLAATR
jgi:protein-L-isoaspartate O-methyltransferase